jgi:hypothetical protein
MSTENDYEDDIPTLLIWKFIPSTTLWGRRRGIVTQTISVQRHVHQSTKPADSGFMQVRSLIRWGTLQFSSLCAPPIFSVDLSDIVIILLTIYSHNWIRDMTGVQLQGWEERALTTTPLTSKADWLSRPTSPIILSMRYCVSLLSCKQ